MILNSSAFHFFILDNKEIYIMTITEVGKVHMVLFLGEKKVVFYVN